MYNYLVNIINFGINNTSRAQASKIKITNVTSLIASFVALSYALFFYIQIGSAIAALLNITFALVYALPLILSYNQHYRSAKILIFAAVMSHVFVLCTLIFTSATGFHYYYLLLPSCLFLMFGNEEKYEKLFAIVLGLILFFICEYYNNPAPLVEISTIAEKIIFSSTILVVMLEIYLVTFIFSNAVTRNEARLQQMATKDWLTGLNNRGMFVEIGQSLITQSMQQNKPLSLLMLDIDFFKQINDNHGHFVGDQVLKQISKTLQKGTRSNDTLARYGGEEFVIILPNTTSEESLELAQKIRVMIENTPLPREESKDIKYTVSIGVAQTSLKIDTLDELTRCADIALYKAKESGRNNVSVLPA